MDLKTYRINRLCQAGKKAGYHTLVASAPANIYYMTNGYKSIGQHIALSTQLYTLLDIESGQVSYIAPVAEIPGILEHAGLDTPIYAFGPFHFDVNNQDAFARQAQRIFDQRYPSPLAALAAALLPRTKGKTGLDESRVNFVQYEKLVQIINQGEISPASRVFQQARMVKHPDEIAGLAKAAQIAETALRHVLNGFEPGMTEMDLETMYRQAVIAKGADPYFFVATAAHRSAYVDAVNTSLPIEKGHMIRFDFGCIADGYYSDLARTVSVGQPTNKAAHTYEAVKAGAALALSHIKPGIIAAELFAMAQKGVRDNGLEHYTRHHCGHGIGLEGYDLPSIAEKDSTPLQKDMVLCLETPYYQLGWGGVQIENTVAVTQTGYRPLDSGRQELIIL